MGAVLAQSPGAPTGKDDGGVGSGKGKRQNGERWLGSGRGRGTGEECTENWLPPNRQAGGMVWRGGAAAVGLAPRLFQVQVGFLWRGGGPAGSHTHGCSRGQGRPRLGLGMGRREVSLPGERKVTLPGRAAAPCAGATRVCCWVSSGRHGCCAWVGSEVGSGQ